MPTSWFVQYPPRRDTSCVLLGRGAVHRLGEFTRAVTRAKRVLLVHDARVARLHGRAATLALRRAGLAVVPVRVPLGEAAKQPSVLLRLWGELADGDIGRSDVLVALGGGAVGDVAGFAAATWLRGVPWICVPTTLLAQVDSSVGGKTAVNLPAGKNLPGAFHQPAGVLADPDLLATLPPRQRRAGLAEVVKMGMAVDAGLFRWIERRAADLDAAEPQALADAVGRAIRAKLRVVRADPWERPGGPRTALNFGHTAGHALEAAAGYRGVLHGEAVAVGMRIAAELSVRHAGLDPASRDRLTVLLDRLRLPRGAPELASRGWWQALGQDKKRDATAVRWVLTPRMGHASVPRPIQRRFVQSVLIAFAARG